jgi:hypothetical protein
MPTLYTAPHALAAAASMALPSKRQKMLQNNYMILDWTNWTFWLTALALVAFGFILRVIYEQWHSRKIRKQVRDDAHEIRDLTQRLQTATEHLNNANAEQSQRLAGRPARLTSKA